MKVTEFVRANVTKIKFFKKGTILQNKGEVHLKAFYV